MNLISLIFPGTTETKVVFLQVVGVAETVNV